MSFVAIWLVCDCQVTQPVLSCTDPHPFQIPAQPDPTHPVPSLIALGTPVNLRILICLNDEFAEGPLTFLNALGGAIYKFWQRMRTFIGFV